MKKFIPAIISIAIFLLFICLPPDLISKKSPLKVTTSDGANLNDTTFKGRVIQENLFKSQEYYPILGSSELEKPDPFHPIHMFKAMDTGKKPFLIGTGGSTDIIHAINIGSKVGEIKGKKLAIIISPQWFTDKGVDDNNFSARYSELQLDDLLNNEHLSKAFKQKMSRRLMDFTATKDKRLVEYYANDGDRHNLTVEEKIYNNLMKKNDAVKSVLMLSNNVLQRSKTVDIKGKSWDEIYQIAEQYGKHHSTNNIYGMDNAYYKKILHHQKKLYRNNEFFINSKEFDDLDLLLEALKEAEADPLFIVLPVNGKWYDHINLPFERRQPVYQKINDHIYKYGFKTYDMSGMDYMPYVIKDAVHIGWEGWAFADAAMILHMQGKYPDMPVNKFNH
ncbi:D-alanyl-lipoteichoic acid biosynthesis protein DltD [Macrococcus capreoli]|uniref:D-alanyl-lipoteichoic acid biosynthesis protein DltD n=1 Tax=Macrococcus capreoli TaxID=2982690 RepID=UPI003EE6F120